jgi:phenylacetic acid degradation operon negative regulatory protein
MKDSDLLIGIMASLGRQNYSIGQLISLSVPFSVTSISVRTNISRLKKKGILKSEKHDGKSLYSFARKGKAITDNVSLSFVKPDWKYWSGEFWGLVYSFSENNKKDRYRMTKKLSLYRFAMLYPGFWIRPYSDNEHLDSKLESIFNNKNCRVIKFHPVVPLSKKEADLLWNINDASSTMMKAIEEATGSLSMARNYSPEKAFYEKLIMGERIVAALFMDPLLPGCFLPSDWPGDKLRKIFIKLDSLLNRISEPFWNNILTKEILE